MTLPVFESKNSGWSNFSASQTVSLNSGANAKRCVIALATYWTDNTVTLNSATYAGVTMTAGTAFTLPNGERARAFWLFGDANVASGANNLVVSASSNTGKIDVACIAYSSVDETSGVSGAVNAAATSTTPSWVVTSDINSIVVALWMMGPGAGAVTPGSGVTLRHELRNTNIADEEIWEKAGASSVTINGSVAAPTPLWGGTALSVLGSAAAATPSNPARRAFPFPILRH